jgi:RNA polymerase sigma factor (TIGR02999 family)
MPSAVTVLLARWRDGDPRALEELTPLVYEQLRQIASRQLAGEREGHTLSATAVVHEAYLRLLGDDTPWRNRAHFLAVAAREMKRVLIDHARTKKRQKRGGAWRRVTLDGQEAAGAEDAVDILAVAEALDELAKLDPRKAELVDLMMFGGLTAAEAGEALKISEATVHREWRMARAWLRHALKPKTP